MSLREIRDEAVSDELPFEVVLEKLKQLLSEMESGKLGLEEMITRYGEGIKLVQSCEKRLQGAEKRVHELMEKNGQIVLKPTKEL